jgi:hypothetical protein
MCIACELGFWMAMEEAPAAKPKRKTARANESFQCDAPAEQARPTPRRAKARRRVRTSSADATRE